MSQAEVALTNFLHTSEAQVEDLLPIPEMLKMLAIRFENGPDMSSLPFAPGDTTAGSEAELQTIVEGKKHQVDLPITIEQSNYFADMLRRAAAGDAGKRASSRKIS